MSHPSDKYYELERHLFEQVDEFQYEFHPFDQQDAEYWLSIYSHWLFRAKINGIEYKIGNIKFYESAIGGRIQQINLEKEIKIANEKVKAIYQWYHKQDLVPLNTDSLIPFGDEWDAMLEGYDIRAENWYNTKLKNRKNKFAKIDNETEKIDNSESFDRKDWGAIYRLAEDMRFRREQGEFETYEDAYRHAEKYNTVNGKTITVSQLRNNYYKTKSSSPLLDD